jgi:hypothetical protein
VENEYKEEACSPGQPVAQPLQSDDKPVQQSSPHKQEDESPLGSITSKEQPEEQEAQKTFESVTFEKLPEDIAVVEAMTTFTTEPDEPDSTGQPVARSTEPTTLSTKNTTCWVVHSGDDHGDLPLLQNLNFQVLFDERWFDCGNAHKGDHRLRRLKQEKPELVIIYMTNIRKTQQPRHSLREMLEQVSEVVQEQLRSGRHAIVYGYNYEFDLWPTRYKRRGPRNWELPPDAEHPMFPIHSLVCAGSGDSPVARGTLRQYLVRQCQFGVVGPETGMPSNKLVRVLSSLSLGKEAKANCDCGAAGKRHYETGPQHE